MGAHSRLSPSSAVRWTACPGSIAAEAGYPDTSGDAAELGTHAHAALEFCLANSINSEGHWDHMDLCVTPMDQVGAWFYDRDMSAETAAAIEHAYNYVRDTCMTYPDTVVHTEINVDPAPYVERSDMSGTADIILYNPVVNFLKVIDYKNGTGYVDAADNLQMIIYFFGAMARLLLTEYPVINETVIIQPNAQGEPIRAHSYTPHELWYTINWVAEQAAATDDPNAPRLPSEKACQWCKARGDCPERAEAALNTARTVFAPLMLGEDIDAGFDSSEVPGLSPEVLNLILSSKAFITAVFSDVEEYVRGELMAGRSVPGYKLIEGRMSQSWRLGEEELVERFKNTSTTSKKKLTQSEYLNITPISPAQAAKRIKPLVSDRTWSNLSELIDKKPGKPQLVPEGHRKPAINQTPETVFSKIEQGPDFLS